MPTYTNLRWWTAPEGWELYGVRECDDFTSYQSVELLAWVYENHQKKTWTACVYSEDFPDQVREFPTLADAQAWAWACVRLS